MHARLAAFVGCTALLAVVSAACGGGGGGGTPGTTPPPTPNACNVTLSGALSASGISCSAAAAWTASSSATVVGFNVPSPPGPISQLDFSFQIPGMLSTGTFDQTTSGLQGGLTVTTGSAGTTAIWLASAGGGNPPPGSFTLTITSTNPINQNASQIQYAPHGTLTGTLPAVQGTAASGTVNVSVSF